MFRAIASDDFAPFGKFELDLLPVTNQPAELGEVHLFTGVNGTGKTRILSLLAAMLGESSPLVRRLKGRAVSVYATEKLPAPRIDLRSCFVSNTSGTGWERSTGNFTQLMVETPAFAYSSNAYITDAEVSVLADVERPTRAQCLSFDRPNAASKNLLQAITNLKIASALDAEETPASPDRLSNPRSLVQKLETTLSHITGLAFSFQVTRFPKLALGVKWGGTSLAFDVLPDGLRSIIGWLVHAVVMMELWVQGKSDPMQANAIFLLDEIECHLHPAWQRKILPAFQRLFPKSQIFVATHSPFVIASLNHGWIHPLSLNSEGKAKFEKPIEASSGDSYVSVVEEIMGIKEWYDPETEALLAEFRKARDEAYRGDSSAQLKARDLASQIGTRSVELEYMMGREIVQLDRQLAKNGAKQ